MLRVYFSVFDKAFNLFMLKGCVTTAYLLASPKFSSLHLIYFLFAVIPVIAIAQEHNLVRIFNQVKLRNAIDKFRWLGSDSWKNLNFQTGYPRM